MKDHFSDDRITWNNLWRIKNPTLRAIRQKILYRDVWSNDKRYRLGLSSSDKCLVCGEKETVEHQLFQCRNAMKLWNIYWACINHRNFSSKTSLTMSRQTMASLLEVSGDLIQELVKAVIFKHLIQIDRSVNLTEGQIRRSVLYWITIESTVLAKLSRRNRFLLDRLESIKNYLNK